MRLTLISPRLALQKNDWLGSGVPYWPLELAVFAAALRARGDHVSVLDLFGRDVTRLTDAGTHLWQGAPIDDFLTSPAVTEADAIIVYAISFMSQQEIHSILTALRRACPHQPLAVLENSQAVTAFALDAGAEALFAAGADFLIGGEPYFNLDTIIQRLQGKAVTAPNLLEKTAKPGTKLQRLYHKAATYPVPAWDLFPLHGYWQLPYAHGPKQHRYLPILTMRGCPWPCDFCVIPETNDRRWRGRAAADVVAEILTLRDRFGVHDFHVEDVNPTVNFSHWAAIAEQLIQQRADIRFYFVSGTKAETVPLESIPLLAQAGCRYLSISPESGDPQVMQVIGKRFDENHAQTLIAQCRAHGIRTQACFLTGHPAETAESTEQSAASLRRLLAAGLDEAAIFVVAPVPGSALHQEQKITMTKTGFVSFSPTARADYARAAKNRQKLIRTFFIGKLKQGVALWAQGWRALIGCPQTKMENLPRRIAFLLYHRFL